MHAHTHTVFNHAASNSPFVLYLFERQTQGELWLAYLHMTKKEGELSKAHIILEKKSTNHKNL